MEGLVEALKREEEAEAKNKLLKAEVKRLKEKNEKKRKRVAEGIVLLEKCLSRIKRLEQIITCAIDGIDALPPSWDEEAENKLAAIKQNLKQ